MYNPELNTPKAELDRRIEDLQHYLQRNEVDAALILQRVDLFYFSGTIQQGNLYIPARGEPLLMANKSSERARAESAISRIVNLDSPKRIFDILNTEGYPLPRRIGLELDVLPTNLYFTYRKLFPDAEMMDISLPIRMIRAVKSEYEIDIIRQAAAFSDRIAGSVADVLREGMSELEVAGRVEAEARKLGHQGIVRMRLWGSEMFYGHLMAGPSAAVPSFLSSPTGGSGASPAVAQGPGYRAIRRHEPVLFDYVFAYNGYLSDHARIFSLGPVPAELLEAHAAMLEIQEVIKTVARPGVTAGAVYDQACAKAGEFGYADHFMGAAGKERIRFIGHGIGLEVDEFPFLAMGQKLELQAGMIIALEPKAIFPGKGVVGIENTHVVTTDGLEQFGTFPDEITVI